MARRQVDVHVFDAFDDHLSEEWLRGVVDLTLGPERLPKTDTPARDSTAPAGGHTVLLGLVIADDETLSSLNREFRGIDEVTDVLSFPFLHPGETQEENAMPSQEDVPFVVPVDQGEDVPLHMGEVIVSYPQAARQAQTAGHSAQWEVALLVAHGVLHLLGYDHATHEEEAVMWRKQEAVLANLPPEAAP